MKGLHRPYLERVASLSVYHYFPGGPSDLDLFGAVLDARGKLECPEKNMQKHVWTGNQVHISAGTRNPTRDSFQRFMSDFDA